MVLPLFEERGTILEYLYFLVSIFRVNILTFIICSVGMVVGRPFPSSLCKSNAKIVLKDYRKPPARVSYDKTVTPDCFIYLPALKKERCFAFCGMRQGLRPVTPQAFEKG